MYMYMYVYKCVCCSLIYMCLCVSLYSAWPMKITDVTTPVPTPVTTPPLIVVPVVPNNTTDAHVKVSAA